MRKTDMIVDWLVEYRRAVRRRNESSPSQSMPTIRRFNRGRSAVSRQSDVGAKVRVQSLISTRPTKKTRVAIGSNRENAGFACRGVGHTARGRKVPRELHLADVRLLYLISPRVSKGHWVSLLSGARRRGLMCILTHKRLCVKSVFGRQVMGWEIVRGIVKCVEVCDLIAHSNFRSGTLLTVGA